MPFEQQGNASGVVNIGGKIIRVRAATIAPHAAILHLTDKEANCLAYNLLDLLRLCEIETVTDLSGLKRRVIRFAVFFQERMWRANYPKCSRRQLPGGEKTDPLRDSLVYVTAVVYQCTHTDLSDSGSAIGVNPQVPAAWQ